MHRFLSKISALIEAATYVGSTETALGRAKLENQFSTLKRKIPILHLIVLVNALSLLTAHIYHTSLTLSVSLPGALLGVAAIRLVHWIRAWDYEPDAETTLRELRRTLVLTVLLCSGFSIWGLALFEYGTAEHKSFTAIFVYMSAIGSTYCLGSLPQAARYAVYVVGVPIAVRLLSPVTCCWSAWGSICASSRF